MAEDSDTIYIVDNGNRFSHCLKEHLEAQKYRLTLFTGLEAITALDSHNFPELIICDADSIGSEMLADWLRSSQPRPPVLALGSNEDPYYALELVRAGVSDYFVHSKLDLAVLDATIERLCELGRVLRDSREYRSKLELANNELKSRLEELQSDQRAGRQVQMKMLPERRLEFGKIFVDHCIKPSLYLSGDFFDYFALPNNQLGFYFADVSGHGASSAFVTVLLKTLTIRLQRNLKRASSDDILYPERFLSRVNSELMDSKLGKHLTMFVGIIDQQTRTIRYSVGAHYPMPIISMNGSSRYLSAKGPPVGLFEDAVYSGNEEQLAPGFSLTLFSDGILEVINADSLAQKEVILLETVQQRYHTVNYEKSVDSVARLEQSFRLDEIEELPDDVAILTITERVVS